MSARGTFQLLGDQWERGEQGEFVTSGCRHLRGISWLNPRASEASRWTSVYYTACSEFREWLS
jgi:hypothetical protein